MATLLHDLMDRYGDDSEKVVALVRAMGANAVEHLLPSLADEEGVYRTMAAQLLAMLGDRRAVAPLAAGLGASGLRTARALREYRERRRAYKDGPRPGVVCTTRTNWGELSTNWCFPCSGRRTSGKPRRCGGTSPSR